MTEESNTTPKGWDTIDTDTPHAHLCEQCGNPMTCESLTDRLGEPCAPFDWYQCEECEATAEGTPITLKIDGKERTMRVRTSEYTQGGGLAVSLFHMGEPFLTLSVNVPSADLAPGEFVCKQWSENAPYIAGILASGIFEDTGKRVATGFITNAPVWRFAETPEPKPIPQCENCEACDAVVTLTLCSLDGTVLDSLKVCAACAPTAGPKDTLNALTCRW